MAHMRRLLRKAYILAFIPLLLLLPRPLRVEHLLTGYESISVYSYSLPSAENCECAGGIYISRMTEAEYREKAPRGFAVSLTFSDKSAEEVLAKLGAAERFRQDLDGTTVIYAYSRSVSGEVVVMGSRINVQIAVSDGVLTVGSPLIAGSY